MVLLHPPLQRQTVLLNESWSTLTPLKYKVLTFSVLPSLFIIFYFLFICVALSLQLTGGCRPLQHHFYVSMRLFLSDRLQMAQVHSGTWSLCRRSLNVCLETLLLKYVHMQWMKPCILRLYDFLLSHCNIDLTIFNSFCLLSNVQILQYLQC